MNIKPQTLDTSNKNFNEKFISRLRINSSTNKKIQSLVNTIIANIKKRGDTSLISYVKKYDGYNLRVLTYLCGKGISNKISWFSPDNFNEPEIYNSGSDKCHIFIKNKIETSSGDNTDDINKIIRSINDSISKNNLSETDIKNLLEDKNKMSGGSCKKHNLKNDCEASSNCFWDGECSEKFCHEATDNETCESDEVYASKCYWDNMDENNKCKHRPS